MFILRVRETDNKSNVVWKRMTYECPHCTKKIVALFKNDILTKMPFIQRLCIKCYEEVPDLEYITRHIAARKRYHISED